MQVVEVFDKDFYSVIEDRHGAKAYVYFRPQNNHDITFHDNNGVEFYHESFEDCSIELVEQAAIDWATGKRELL